MIDVDSQIKDIENNVDAQFQTVVHVYNTVYDMKNDTSINSNIRCKTLGYRKAGDGGGGFYYITSENSNGCNIIELKNGLNAKLIVENAVNFKQLGGNGWSDVDPLSNYFFNLSDAQAVYPFVTTLNTSINNVIMKVALENFKDIYFPSGVFYFNENISIPSNKKICGAGMKQTYLKQTTTTRFILIPFLKY